MPTGVYIDTDASPGAYADALRHWHRVDDVTWLRAKRSEVIADQAPCLTAPDGVSFLHAPFLRDHGA